METVKSCSQYCQCEIPGSHSSKYEDYDTAFWNVALCSLVEVD
jgi:hypothetical protein